MAKKNKIKTRAERLKEYKAKYSHIPDDINERLHLLLTDMGYNKKRIDKILKRKKEIIENTQYNEFSIILNEVPLPAQRPRKRGLGMYSPLAAENSEYMEGKVKGMERIVTPMFVHIEYFLPIPETMNMEDKVLAELGFIHPISTPDVDNIAKSYLDMSNVNVFLDDALVVSLRVDKYYSIKPRVELHIRYQSTYECTYLLKKVIKSEKYKKMYEEGNVYDLIEDLKKRGVVKKCKKTIY